MRDCPEKIYSGFHESSASKKVEHYKRPEELPFLHKELSSTTLIFGGLTWKHEILLKASFENLGYICDILPNPDFEALQLGKEFCDPGLCNPVYFTFGALLKYLRKIESQGLTKKEIISNYVFFTAGSCGPCRFGMYESQFGLGLKNSGFEGFRVIVFQQNEGLDQSKEESALKFNHDFFLRILTSFVLADLINDMVYQYRPYEIVKGSVDKLLHETMSNAYLKLKLIRYPYIITLISKLAEKKLISKNLPLLLKIIFFTFCSEYKEILNEFIEGMGKLKYDFSRIKPIVKITGEFWAQTTEGDGNLNMHHYLEENGAQVIPEPLSNWIMYMLHQQRLNKSLDLKRKSDGIKAISKNFFSIIHNYYELKLLNASEILFKGYFNRYRKKLRSIPHLLVSQNKIRKSSQNYFNPFIEGGEGHLEIGKTLYYSQTKQCHMVISLKPFGCMPSSMSDGIMSSVTSHNYDILFSSIETGGEGIVNMYSRVLMTLNEAKEMARNEYAGIENKLKIKNGDNREPREHSFYAFTKTKNKQSAISIASRFLLKQKEK